MSPEQEKTYYKASLGLKKEIAAVLDEEYSSALIDGLKTQEGRLDLPGTSIRLAKEFGFCYGVDKAVDLAYEARRKFPDKRIFLLTEIIHNPRVNRRLDEMGILFLEGEFNRGLSFEDITPEDVVLIPAFGTDADRFQRLKDLGAIIVDTTCGSVVHVWKRVERYARDGFTSLVHGKYNHEETLATVSQASANGGPFIVVYDKSEAQAVCSFIRGEIGAGELIAIIPPGALSADFDPARHLSRIGVANQTTMLASESLEIAEMVGQAIEVRYGASEKAGRFRSFDTICSATQDRQDAIRDLVGTDPPPDLVLVIGGYNSSNTRHLLEVALTACPAYHIMDAGEILSSREIRHQPLTDKSQIVTRDWLPEGPLRIGVTAGASTPNRAIADTIARVLELRGLPLRDALEALIQDS